MTPKCYPHSLQRNHHDIFFRGSPAWSAGTRSRQLPSSTCPCRYDCRSRHALVLRYGDKEQLHLRFWDRVDHGRSRLMCDSNRGEKIAARTRIYGMLATRRRGFSHWFDLRYTPRHLREGEGGRCGPFAPGCHHFDHPVSSESLSRFASAWCVCWCMLAGLPSSDLSLVTDATLRYIRVLLSDDDSCSAFRDTVMEGCYTAPAGSKGLP